ncbi:MAG: glycosyltransferase family 39 protein [Planctomycetales bacterium]|nr:glycosyltransferase family 39 protein [Planctomycetales bacterium]
MAGHTTTQLASARRFLTPALLLLLALLLRIPSIGQPLVGVFATKNVVYAMIARNWIAGHAPCWCPTLDVLVDGQRSWHLVELPVSAYLAGGLWALLGGSLDVWGRLVSIAFSLVGVAALYALLLRWHGRTVATVGAALLGIAPVSVVYGQKFMLEPSVAALSILALYTAERWFDSRRLGWLAALLVSLALLLLTKCYMAVIVLPLGARLLQTLRRDRCAATPTNDWRLFAATSAAVALAAFPAALWYTWAYTAAAPGETLSPPLFFSVRDSAATHPLPSPLLWDPAFYARWLRDVATIGLTPVGFVLFAVGLVQREARQHLPWLAASLLLVVLLPRKFHEMNYYFLVILPPLCAVAALGWQRLSERWRPSRLAVIGVATALMLPALRYSASPSYLVPEEDRTVTTAAAAVRPLLTPDEPVATMHGTTIDLLYYCGHPGWAVAPDRDDLTVRLGECRRQGARLLVVAGLSWQQRHAPCRRLLDTLEPVATGDDYAVYRLPEVDVLTSDAARRRSTDDATKASAVAHLSSGLLSPER